MAIEKSKLKSRILSVNFTAIADYLLKRRTPARILIDSVTEELMPLLEGTVVEIGAKTQMNYKQFALSAEEYVLSNVVPDKELIYLDAMNMHFDDNSIDTFVCIAVLEHLNDPWKAVKEMHRALKPGGKLLLIVPFIYPFHGAPDDFYRFSSSALFDMLKEFKIIHLESLGNYWSTLALFLQGPTIYRETFRRLLVSLTLVTLLRFMGIIAYLISRSKKSDNYAILYCVIAEKQ